MPSLNLIKALLPSETGNYQESIQSRMFIFCALISFFGGTYAFIKWTKLGHPLIPWTSLSVCLLSAAVLAANKYSLLPQKIIGQLIAGMIVIYMTSLVYSLGGIASNHSFWMLATIVYVFLLTGYAGGIFWSCILCVATFYGLFMEYHFTPIPIFEISEDKKFNVAISGHLAPQIFTAIAMAYIIKLRTQALKDSQAAYEDVRAQTITSTQLSEQLVNILQQSSLSAGTLLESAEELSNMTTRINQTSLSMKSGIDQQLSTTNTANQTLGAMAGSVNETSEAVNKISQNGEAVKHTATQSSLAMKEAMSCMEQIADGNENIRDYVGVISAIAAQTNLLALNAAIEAARAGEHGRGFAVVADEVRNLSNRSNEAASEISGLISSSEQNIEKGTGIVRTAGEQLNEVAAQIEAIFQSINFSAEKLKTQNEGINGILDDSREVEKVCQENVHASESLLGDAALLTHVASKLSDLSLVMSATVKKAESIEGIDHSSEGGEAELF